MPPTFPNIPNIEMSNKGEVCGQLWIVGCDSLGHCDPRDIPLGSMGTSNDRFAEGPATCRSSQSSRRNPGRRGKSHTSQASAQPQPRLRVSSLCRSTPESVPWISRRFCYLARMFISPHGISSNMAMNHCTSQIILVQKSRTNGGIWCNFSQP